MCSNSATVDAVFDSLGSFYWSSLTREVANLILAYREFLDEQDGPTNYESQTTVDGGPNFERFCSIWGKIDTRHKSDPETEIDLCQPDHLRKQFGNKAKAKNQLKFESRLRDKELRDNGVESPTWRRVANSLVDPTRYGNAGTIHFGVTFGPLMIQNGIPLSVRPCTWKSSHILTIWVITQHIIKCDYLEKAHAKLVLQTTEEPVVWH
ncbi:hypothetical protein PG996_002728 [Apiospora saccharicola]|uniref:Uncharacterized protein n=1 Tax=Apiospora saccharicola TaxID=335842 RepID=A0ABR1WLP1_9PEZI